MRSCGVPGYLLPALTLLVLGVSAAAPARPVSMPGGVEAGGTLLCMGTGGPAPAPPPPPRRDPDQPIVASPAELASLIRKLSSPDPVVRIQAARDLAPLGEAAAPAIPALVSLLGDEALGPNDPNGDGLALAFIPVGAEAGRTLLCLGRVAFRPLLGALRDPNERVRLQTAMTLPSVRMYAAGESVRMPCTGTRLTHGGLRRARYALVRALADPAPKVREFAALALGQLGEGGATEALVRALGDAEYLVRHSASVALVRLGDPRGLEALIPLLQDPVPSVRQIAAWGVGQLGTDQARQALVGALADDDPGVRASAARGLEGFRDPETIAALERTLQDPDPNVQQAAKGALSIIRINLPREGP